jgi:hypothetical protein
MGELYSDPGILDDMVKALGRHGPMTPKALAKEVGRSEQEVLEQLTESYYFQPSPTKGNRGKYELNGRGRDRFDKIG